MTEKQLIDKIKELRCIKPRDNWVFLTKERIFNQESKESVILEKRTSYTFGELINGLKFVLGHKLAFASIAVLAIFIGSFGFIQNSLPGDSLYVIKRIAEKSNVIFNPGQERSKRSLELANRRLDDLTKIAQSNSIKNLASTINEYKANVLDAAENIIKQESGQDLKKIQEIVFEVQKLEENRKKVRALGVVIDGTEELDNALAQLVKREIKDIENRVLTEKQQEILENVKNDYNEGKYTQALEKILFFGSIDDIED